MRSTRLIRSSLLFGPSSYFSRNFYDSRTKNETIFAPLTTINPNEGSPLGVIRLSGVKTGQILHQITKGKNTIKKSIIEPRKATLTKFYNFNDNHELIDIGLVLWFPGPNSYTGEDCCEFHIHGSQAIQTTILNILGSIDNVRPAEPGEFTRRAVINNKMSLIQAEGLAELISSKTDNQRKLSLKGLSGATRQKYETWAVELTQILAHMEAIIDFGEDDLVGEKNVLENCIKRIEEINSTISTFIQSNSYTRNYIHNGFRLAILGKPNAGKSTLMNIICKKDKSIVSNLSGTTRDVVEHSFEIGGHAITLSDTAGLRKFEKSGESNELLEKHDSIEREGIRRALEVANLADILIYMIDATKFAELSEEEIIQTISTEVDDLMQLVGNNVKNVHLVINKIDLFNNEKSHFNCDKVKETLVKQTNFKDCTELLIKFISCASNENVNDYFDNLSGSLDKLISNNNHTNAREELNNFDFINERHIALLKSTQKHLELAQHFDLSSIDQVAQHVRESLDYISRIVGTISEEQVFDVIFRDFCIGK